MPHAPDSAWLSAKLFTHPERIGELVSQALPSLLSTLGTPTCWWLRYRSPQETDHLRLRLHTGADRYAECSKAIGEWTQRMRQVGLVGRLVIDTYVPEIGRYGPGEAMDAVENVFAADSTTVTAMLRNRPVTEPNLALAVTNMVGIVRGFFGDSDEAMDWLVTRPAPAAAAIDRTAAKRAIQLATDPTGLLSLPDWRADIRPAWENRADALASYRKALPPGTNTDVVLESLLHMHHNRLIGIDRDSERTCRRLTRQAALTWRHRPGGVR